MKKRTGIFLLICLTAALICGSALAAATTVEEASDITTDVMYSGFFREEDSFPYDSEYGFGFFVAVKYYYRWQSPDQAGWAIFGSEVKRGADMWITVYNSSMEQVCGGREESLTHRTFRTVPGEIYYIVPSLVSARPGVTDFEKRTYRFIMVYNPDPEGESEDTAIELKMGEIRQGTVGSGQDMDYFTFRTGEEDHYAFTALNEDWDPDWDLRYYVFQDGNYVGHFLLKAPGVAGTNVTDMFQPDTTYTIKTNSSIVPFETFLQKPLPTYQIGIGPAARLDFSAGGGSGEMGPWYRVPGETLTLPECGFTPPEGKTFDTWDLGAPGTEVTLDRNRTCTARWKRDPNRWPEESEYTFVVDGMKYRIISATEVTFLGLEKARSRQKVTLPEKVWYPETVFVFDVTEIAAKALYKDTKVTTVSIGPRVRTIGKNAFASCTKLKSVKNGKAVTEIRDGAFQGCRALTSFPTPGGLTNIGAGAFKSCAKLTKFTLGSQVQSVGKSAFEGCKALKTVTVKTGALTAGNLGKNAWKGISAKAVFKCPKANRKDYQKLFVKRGAPKTSKFK